MANLFISGIGTDVGKTIVSAIVCGEALAADYWKPIQTGAADNPDMDAVQGLISNAKTVCHPSSVQLQLPASPNIAAKAEQKAIYLNDIVFPHTSNNLIIEGAGGLLVPLNETQTFADFIAVHQLPIILVVRNYLGCINHTLLSLAYIKAQGFRVFAGVFNGNFAEGVTETIQQHSGIRWLTIADTHTINAEFIRSEANKIRPFIVDFA